VVPEDRRERHRRSEQGDAPHGQPFMRTPYASQAALDFADCSMEAVCYHAYWASTELASERGRYSSYRGSLWDRGILPIDSLDLLAKERGGRLDADVRTGVHAEQTEHSLLVLAEFPV